MTYFQQASDATNSFISTFVDKGATYVDMVVDKVAQITDIYSKNFQVQNSDSIPGMISMQEDQLNYLLKIRKSDPILFGRIVDAASHFKNLQTTEDKEKLIDDFLLGVSPTSAAQQK
jgi:hypothetical protein